MVDRPGTAPGSYGLKGRRATFLLAVHLGLRFHVLFFANHDLARVAEMMNPLALKAHRL
jgi:hypothetical protein